MQPRSRCESVLYVTGSSGGPDCAAAASRLIRRWDVGRDEDAVSRKCVRPQVNPGLAGLMRGDPPRGRVVRAHDEDIVVTRLTRDRMAECLDRIVVLDAAIKAELGPTYSEEEWGAEQFQLEMPGKFQYSLVILGTKEVVGYLIVSKPQPDMLHIHRLAVAASTRDQGLATCLMDILLKRARHEGVTLIRLKVHPSNRAARAFYEKLGFTPMEASGSDSDDSPDHLLLTLGKGRRG